MPLSLRFSAVSDVGRTRKKNDDSGYAGPHFVMIADGMGGAAAGDLASAVAVQTMRRLDAIVADDMLEALAGSISRANDRLAELVEEDSAVSGMGTTVTAAIFDGEHIGVAHIGDSRGYLWRDGELLRITHDHTWVQSLIDEGRITEEEAKVHSHRSLLLKVLDGRHDNDPDLTVYDVQAGDRVLLCSDGLSGFVDHDRIERVLSIGTADSVAAELVQLALEAASTDNITVVVADVVDEQTDDRLLPVTVGSAAESLPGTLSRLRAWGNRDDSDTAETLLDPDVDSDIDPEELRYAPREPRRFRWLKRSLLLLLVLATVVVVGNLSYDYTQRQYYVAADGEQVVIYQGIQASLPGISLHEVYETQDMQLSELPTFRRSQVVEGMQADDLNDARAIIERLRSFAETCAARALRASSSTTPTASSSGGQPNTASSGPRRTVASPSSDRPPSPRRTQNTTTPGAADVTRTSDTPRNSRNPTSDAREPAAPKECSGATPVPTSTP